MQPPFPCEISVSILTTVHFIASISLIKQRVLSTSSWYRTRVFQLAPPPRFIVRFHLGLALNHTFRRATLLGPGSSAVFITRFHSTMRAPITRLHRLLLASYISNGPEGWEKHCASPIHVLSCLISNKIEETLKVLSKSIDVSWILLTFRMSARPE